LVAHVGLFGLNIDLQLAFERLLGQRLLLFRWKMGNRRIEKAAGFGDARGRLRVVGGGTVSGYFVQ